jgi:hypothetical protein
VGKCHPGGAQDNTDEWHAEHAGDRMDRGEVADRKDGWEYLLLASGLKVVRPSRPRGGATTRLEEGTAGRVPLLA